jgi:hypothetical protein
MSKPSAKKPNASPSLADRVVALLSVARRSLTVGEMSAGLLTPEPDITAACAELGTRLRQKANRWRLAPVAA